MWIQGQVDQLVQNEYKTEINSIVIKYDTNAFCARARVEMNTHIIQLLVWD